MERYLCRGEEPDFLSPSDIYKIRPDSVALFSGLKHVCGRAGMWGNRVDHRQDIFPIAAPTVACQDNLGSWQKLLAAATFRVFLNVDFSCRRQSDAEKKKGQKKKKSKEEENIKRTLTLITPLCVAFNNCTPLCYQSLHSFFLFSIGAYNALLLVSVMVTLQASE